MSGKLMLKRILLLAAVSISAAGCVKGLGIEDLYPSQKDAIWMDIYHLCLVALMNG